MNAWWLLVVATEAADFAVRDSYYKNGTFESRFTRDLVPLGGALDGDRDVKNASRDQLRLLSALYPVVEKMTLTVSCAVLVEGYIGPSCRYYSDCEFLTRYNATTQTWDPPVANLSAGVCRLHEICAFGLNHTASVRDAFDKPVRGANRTVAANAKRTVDANAKRTFDANANRTSDAHVERPRRAQSPNALVKLRLGVGPGGRGARLTESAVAATIFLALLYAALGVCHASSGKTVARFQ